jgi:hypothetical protein
MCSYFGRKREIRIDYNLFLFFNKSCVYQDLNSDISDSDIILNYYISTSSSKSLS